jgi:2-polyprenyl-3-methyl-5-hydroxy-6-metoxy-1,4-benzoquinol methylase
MQDEVINAGSCNLCGSGRFRMAAGRIREGGDYKVYACLSCGHVQLLPRPAISEDKNFYDKDSQERSLRKDLDLGFLEGAFRADVLRRADFISARFPKGKALLDIGCGYGFFLKEMRARGYDAKGVEISVERRRAAKDVTDAQIFDANLADAGSTGDIGQYGIVTLFHVLEHMADPIGFCRNVRKLVKKGGCLLVEAPNVSELMLGTSPAYNGFYWNRAHLNYFGKNTLEKALSGAGFKKIEVGFVQRYGIQNLCHWLGEGKPQLSRPAFEMPGEYRWLEGHYREHLSREGSADTLFAVAYAD